MLSQSDDGDESRPLPLPLSGSPEVPETAEDAENNNSDVPAKDNVPQANAQVEDSAENVGDQKNAVSAEEEDVLSEFLDDDPAFAVNGNADNETGSDADARPASSSDALEQHGFDGQEQITQVASSTEQLLAVTNGVGVDELSETFGRNNDDHSASISPPVPPNAIVAPFAKPVAALDEDFLEPDVQASSETAESTPETEAPTKNSDTPSESVAEELAAPTVDEAHPNGDASQSSSMPSTEEAVEKNGDTAEEVLGTAATDSTSNADTATPEGADDAVQQDATVATFEPERECATPELENDLVIADSDSTQTPEKADETQQSEKQSQESTKTAEEAPSDVIINFVPTTPSTSALSSQAAETSHATDPPPKEHRAETPASKSLVTPMVSSRYGIAQISQEELDAAANEPMAAAPEIVSTRPLQLADLIMGDGSNDSWGTSKIKCADCNESQPTLSDYADHCMAVHNKGQRENMTFDSLEEYEKYVAELNADDTHRVVKRDTIKGDDVTRWTMKCSRSGEIRKGTATSIRCGRHCPMHLKVRHVHADDKVYVEAFWEHLGHDPAYKGAYTEAGEMIGASQSPSTSKAASAPKPGSSGEPQAQTPLLCRHCQMELADLTEFAQHHREVHGLTDDMLDEMFFTMCGFDNVEIVCQPLPKAAAEDAEAVDEQEVPTDAVEEGAAPAGSKKPEGEEHQTAPSPSKKAAGEVDSKDDSSVETEKRQPPRGQSEQPESSTKRATAVERRRTSSIGKDPVSAEEPTSLRKRRQEPEKEPERDGKQRRSDESHSTEQSGKENGVPEEATAAPAEDDKKPTRSPPKKKAVSEVERLTDTSLSPAMLAPSTRSRRSAAPQASARATRELNRRSASTTSNSDKHRKPSDASSSASHAVKKGSSDATSLTKGSLAAGPGRLTRSKRSAAASDVPDVVDLDSDNESSPATAKKTKLHFAKRTGKKDLEPASAQAIPDDNDFADVDLVVAVEAFPSELLTPKPDESKGGKARAEYADYAKALVEHIEQKASTKELRSLPVFAELKKWHKNMKEQENETEEDAETPGPSHSLRRRSTRTSK
ncbi:hypothetical protein AAVH_02347 [Aphelenchoides avenae]|nr:hypothetical protein AAVH_02347 [Aphelenchus avenae]